MVADEGRMGGRTSVFFSEIHSVTTCDGGVTPAFDVTSSFSLWNTLTCWLVAPSL